MFDYIAFFDGGINTVFPDATERTNVEVNAFVIGQKIIRLKCLATLGKDTDEVGLCDSTTIGNRRTPSLEWLNVV